jgi:hypothetical protein
MKLGKNGKERGQWGGCCHNPQMNLEDIIKEEKETVKKADNCLFLFCSFPRTVLG